MDLIARVKRLLLGAALRSDQQAQDVDKRRALPAFASDALSSNVYATQEILMLLAVGGFAFYSYGPIIAGLVAVIFVVVIAAYRHVVQQYPSGGADYEVAAANLGQGAGALVAAAMLIDFALTLAVSVAAIVGTMVSLVPGLDDYRVPVGLVFIVLLAIRSLRGGSELSRLYLYGTYAFVLAILITAAVGAIRMLSGDEIRAASADWEVAGDATTLTGLAFALVLARAFSSGSIAVTGVESIGTAVPSLAKPRGVNAAKTLVALGLVSMALFGSITWLALATGVRITENDADLIGLPAGEAQQTVIIQIANAVYEAWPIVALVGLATILILLAAGSSSFRSFSVLSSILARDGFLPRQLQARGDRLVYSNGIVLLAAASGILVWAFDARLSSLIQLYIVGVFLALTLGQAGMVRHWSKLRDQPGPVEIRRQASRRRWLALLAQFVTGSVLIIVLFSKFTRGAWIVVLLIPVLFLAMRGIRRHYDTVYLQLSAEDSVRTTLPSQVTALILVSRIHKPTLRAIAYARATRPTSLEAVTVAVDGKEALALRREWERRDIPVPLRILESPFREINRPVLEYVARLRRESPRHLLTVYVPEYVVGHWWEQLLHNQSATRLKRRLMMFPNVVVVSVPWQLASAEPLQIDGKAIPPGSGGVTGVTGTVPRVGSDPPSSTARRRR